MNDACLKREKHNAFSLLVICSLFILFNKKVPFEGKLKRYVSLWGLQIFLSAKRRALKNTFGNRCLGLRG